MPQPDELEDVLGMSVSRETLDRLETYSKALVSWSKRINLIAPNSYNDTWSRHIIDSAQIMTCAGSGFSRTWCDLGSGGGLPGLVIAIIGLETHPDLSVTLIESDQRKAAFLKIISGQLGLRTKINAERIEIAEPSDAQVVSARALAPLEPLLGYCARHVRQDGVSILSKGRNWRNELEDARRSWHFDYDVRESRVDRDSVILVIRNLRRLDSIT